MVQLLFEVDVQPPAPCRPCSFDRMANELLSQSLHLALGVDDEINQERMTRAVPGDVDEPT